MESKRRSVIELTALRPQSAESAARLRKSVALRLAAIAAEATGTELELGMFTNMDGMVDVDIVVSGGQQTDAIASEIAELMHPIAELSVHEYEHPVLSEWPLVADARPRALGFAPDPEPAPPTVAWHGAEVPTPQLLEELSTLPGHGLRIRLLPTCRQQARWSAELGIVTAGQAPSLRSRSMIRNRFPGLQISLMKEDRAARLVLDERGLADVFAVPVGDVEPLAGTYVAPSAPIPVTPSRRPAAGGVRIGHAVTGGGRPISVELEAEERLRHIHVLGRTGTGKSTVLAGMAHAIAQRGEGMLIMDPHGSLCDRILAELPDHAIDRVWLIRCGDVENPVPINPLAEDDPVRRDIAIADLCATFQYIFDPKETGIVGPRFHERVGMTLRALAAVHGVRASLLDVPIASENELFMAAAVRYSSDDRLKSWWKVNGLAKRSNEFGEVLAWVNSKFERFSNTAALRAVLGSGCNAMDFTQAMDDDRIILVDLSKAELGEQASCLLGYLYLGRVWAAALRRRRDRPFTVMVDEAHTVISGSLANMLSEGRKFGLSVVLAHQFLDQLDSNLRPAVDGNVATTIAFRSAVSDAVELQRRFAGLIDASVLVTQPDLSATIMRTASCDISRPHTLVVDHNDFADALDGAALATRLDEIMGRTMEALVNPYRDLTQAATAGVSNVTALPLPLEAVASDVNSPAKAPKAKKTPAAGRSASFLDQWLAERAASGSSRPTGHHGGSTDGETALGGDN
ncbi:type IV secretion system DNA-binding domain-containing protein [Mycobacterium sp. M26]|uniref:type IV secretory system conjugative DNA transfer family protein n=1 Tax=Mycobacterium sp. M26 TaxID=1762962 RepID=UPI00073E8D4A|nr:type IV secretion system DNA-binding domain-containing protein [Mycobacterium sp. M26]